MIIKDCEQFNPVYGWKDFCLHQGLIPGSGCSKLTTSLVNISLKAKKLISEI